MNIECYEKETTFMGEMFMPTAILFIFISVLSGSLLLISERLAEILISFGIGGIVGIIAVYFTSRHVDYVQVKK